MRFLVTWLALLALWLVLVGTITALEVLAGAVAATIGAAAAELVRSRGLLGFDIRPRWLRRVWRPLVQVVPDFGFVVLVLVRTISRRELPDDAYVAVDLRGRGAEPRSAGWRALVTVAGSLAPNTVVVDVDLERRAMLVHKLLPERGPARPL